jgi:SNF2 family DNA or RNA helicase
MEFITQPWKHQLEAIEKAKKLNEFGLLMQMGTGKTATCINILRHKFNDHKAVLRTIIFCPPIVVQNWKDEWRLHSKIEPSRVIALTGSGKQRLKTFLDNAYKAHDLEGQVAVGQVFVTNYESLLMDDLFDAFKAWVPQALVFDESHKIKDLKAKRTKRADILANPRPPKFGERKPRPYVYILSGSPVLNSPLDIFSQFLVLDGGHTFGANFFAFRARYFRDANAGMPKDKYFPKWELIPGSLDDINKKIFNKSMRVEKKDCLDLPPEISQVIRIGMSAEQARAYKEMKQDFVTYMGDKACVATLAIVKALRLMQITSGFISLEGQGQESDPTRTPFPDTPKMESLRELLEEITPHSKILVWAVWKENYRQIGDLLRSMDIDYVEIHGGISASQKDANIARFKTDPKCRVFLGHPGSGGIGINLVNAPYSIFYSRTFSLEHYLQARARNHRGGSKEAGHEKITHYDLVCEKTIDEIVVDKLSQKIDIGEKMLKDIAKELQAF